MRDASPAICICRLHSCRPWLEREVSPPTPATVVGVQAYVAHGMLVAIENQSPQRAGHTARGSPSGAGLQPIAPSSGVQPFGLAHYPSRFHRGVAYQSNTVPPQSIQNCQRPALDFEATVSAFEKRPNSIW